MVTSFNQFELASLGFTEPGISSLFLDLSDDRAVDRSTWRLAIGFPITFSQHQIDHILAIKRLASFFKNTYRRAQATRFGCGAFFLGGCVLAWLAALPRWA